MLAILFIIFSFVQQARSQALTYKMTALGKNIGTMKVYKNSKNGFVYYYTRTDLDVNLLVKRVKLSSINNTIYKNQALYKSDVTVEVNGNNHSSSHLHWDGNQYQVKLDGKSANPISSLVNMSGTLLNFQEPKDIQTSFSEASGQFITIKKKKEGVYETIDPGNDRKMRYYYTKGVLTKMEVKHPLLTITLSLQ
ncbi:MAG: DUF6134 family protein [Bacteroidota bacterium]